MACCIEDVLGKQFPGIFINFKIKTANPVTVEKIKARRLEMAGLDQGLLNLKKLIAAAG
jgi:hypothetical protein